MSGDELDYYWSDISQVFNLSHEFRIQNPHYNVKSTILSQETLNFLKENPEINDFVEDFILDTYNIKLREEIVPEFWQSFAVQKDVDQKDAFDRFERAVTQLHARAALFKPGLQELTRLRFATQNTNKAIFGLTDLHQVFKLQLKGSLHAQLPVNYLTLIKKFYSQAFVVYYSKSTRRYDEDLDEDLACEGCSYSTDLCICSNILDTFKKVNGMLSELGLLRRMTQQALYEILKERIHWHVQESCKGSFEESYISNLVNWLDTSVLGWIRSMYGCTMQVPPLHSTPFSKPKESQEIMDYREKLTQIVFETYTRARIEQLYNIIIEFPESQPALEDLRDCLSRTNLRNFLTSNLRQTLDTKLLHPGVQTEDILSAYIAAIRALRVLDGSGVILELVSANLRKYLKTREDTVKCIVQSLLDESGIELREELMKGEGLQLEDIEDEEVGDAWDEWEPDPVDADPNKVSRSRRTADIISMLVNIYGSKKIFVQEYRTLLSNRLLNQWSYDTEKEIRYLEMLKLRFGDSGEDSVYQCEVMLKDIGDSKRINYQLHSQDGGCPELITQPIRVNSMILSAHFWPQFKTSEPVQLTEQVKEALDVYTKAFQTLKGNRTLEWLSGLGFVNVCVELGHKKLDLKVSPIHASIICKFQEKEEWGVAELSASLKVSATLLRRKLSYWVSQGVVKEMRSDVYGLVDEEQGGNERRLSGSNNQSQVMEAIEDADGDDESLTETRESQREKELSLFWQYIDNMLTNLGPQPIERIHQRLKIFAMQGIECDINELRQFLDKKVRQQILTFAGGQYKLPK
eukprot:TRINITY_DN2363_c0_g1_i3.p1 TRINITY_DN2363_c0_g1~~TRINITY_DN2363_c0_g1_i3.p1  ORF type:complete len:803 (-),score=175.51 TRINITY_DN2363_c0_g1_i3:526-2934(-)